MDQRSRHAASVDDAMSERPGPEGPRAANHPRWERSSAILLRIGAALTAAFVLVPLVGLALVLLFLASLQTWHGGEGAMTDADRIWLGAMALLVMGFAVACVVALRAGLRGSRPALALVAMGGLACIYAGIRGIVEATGIDLLITALSWGVGVTGVVLTLGASLGLVVRAHPRARRRPGR